MSQDKDQTIDAESEPSTTGHEWDGIKEFNTPLPRWWLYTFYATIVFAVGYWLAYPAWPLIGSYTHGILGWQSRTAVVTDVKTLQALRAPMNARIAEASLKDIETTPDSSPSRARRARRPSHKIALPATAPAGKARTAIPISMPTAGSGEAHSMRSTQP